MTNEKDKATTAQVLRHYQIECGSVNAIQKDTLESSIEQALTTVRAEEIRAALSIVRACSTRDELHPDIGITVSEFKERVIGLLEAANRKGEG